MSDHAHHGVEPDSALAREDETSLEADGSDGAYDPHYLGGARKKKRGFSGCLAVLVALAVVVGGAYVAGTTGYHFLKDHLSHAEDYAGPGHGKVLFQVRDGESTTQIGRNLKADGVVASVDAFLEAADDATGIQV